MICSTTGTTYLSYPSYPSYPSYLSYLSYLSYPSVFRWRLDERLRLRASVGPPASREAADGADGHVLVAEDLTRQPDARKLAAFEGGQLGLRVGIRLAAQEFDPARRTARISPARMELVDSGVLFERKDKSLSVGHLERAHAFHSQFWHGQ